MFIVPLLSELLHSRTVAGPLSVVRAWFVLVYNGLASLLAFKAVPLLGSAEAFKIKHPYIHARTPR